MSERPDIFRELKPGRKIACLDFGADSTKILVFFRDKDGEFSLQYEILPKSVGGILRSREKGDFLSALNAAFRRLQIKPRTELVCVTSLGSSVVSKKHGVNPAGRATRTDGQWAFPLKSHGGIDGAEETHATFLLEKKLSYSILLFLEKLGFSGIKILSAAAALSAAMPAAISLEDQSGIVAAIDIGAIATCCYVYENGVLLAAQRFEVGGFNLTKQIAEKIEVSREDAEHIKRAEYERTLTLMSDVFRQVFAELGGFFHELRAHQGMNIRKAVLSGGSSKLHGITFYLEDIIGFPVQAWGLRGAVRLGSDGQFSKRFYSQEPFLATAAGGILTILNPATRKMPLTPSGTLYQAGLFVRRGLIGALVLGSLFFLGIAAERLKIVQDLVAHARVRKEIRLAKTENRYLEVEGINFSATGSVALINGRLFEVNDAITSHLMIRDITAEYVVLFDGLREFKLQPSEYHILKDPPNQ